MGIIERIPEIACPECKSELAEGIDLRCTGCDKAYEVTDGIAQMLDGSVKAIAEEIAVQDSVAGEYEQKRYKDPYAQRYHAWWTDQMLRLIRQRDGRFLDNGCGVGLLFEKVTPEQAVGLDISSEMLRYAAKYSDQLILGNSQKLPFKDQSFDVVFCRSLIHHLPDPESAVKEIARVLRPKGEVVFADTNPSLLSVLPRLIANRGEHFSDEHKNMSRRKLQKLLEPYFKVERVVYFGYIAYPVFGFPDILPVFKYVPFKSLTEAVLMFIDNVLSKLPLIRSQSWGIIVKGEKH